MKKLLTKSPRFFAKLLADPSVLRVAIKPIEKRHLLTCAVVVACCFAAVTIGRSADEKTSITWGTETNGIQSGIETIAINNYSGRPITWVGIHLFNASTNELVVYKPAELEQRFEVSIADSSGKAVKKSELGKKLGQALTFSNGLRISQTSNKQMPRLELKPGTDTKSQDLDPSGLFIAEASGYYRLTVVQRVYFLTTNVTTNPPWTNYFLKPLKLPPVTVDLQIPAGGK